MIGKLLRVLPLASATLAFTFLLVVFHGPLGLAQTPAITPTTGTGSLGTSVTHAGNTSTITGGTRPSNGPNLFHSFGEFGVPTSHLANFLNDTAIPTSNVLGRVTGGNPSNIFGTIQTTGFGSANLFLMNPAGIVFGPNASLNVGGSATFTTADYLRLTDGARFTAMPGSADASISSAPIAAFGFLGSTPGAITVQGGQLSVATGQSLSLVGGDITVQGAAVNEGAAPPVQLSAPGGTINLASAASPGEILAGTLDPAPNVNGQSFGAQGTIQISQKAVLDTSGYDGGTIRIRGGRLVVDDSTISANVTGPAPEPPGQTGTGIDIQMTQDVLIQNLAVLESNVTDQASPGIGSGGVRIRADHIEIVGVPEFDFETFLFPFTGIRSNVAPMSAGGSSGDITLDANSIRMKDASNLQTLTLSTGNGGSIKVITAQNLEMENFGRVGTGSDAASGNAGNIELSSAQGNMLVSNATITSQAALFAESESANGALGTGNTGNITLNAPNGDILVSQEGVVFNTVDSMTGSLGKIDITARNLTLRDGSLIEGSNLTPQLPDNITVMLSERLSLEGNSLITTSAWRSAPAADLTITAPQVLITGGSFLTTDTFASGQGGRLALFTDNLQLTDGGQLRSGSKPSSFASPDAPIPTGAGGTVTVQGAAGPAQSIVIDGVESGIFTDAQGAGAGGNMNLSAQTVTIQNGGVLSASTSGIEPSATGGTISVLAGQSVTLNNGGTITASSTGPANAGNITINQGLSNPASSLLIDGTGSAILTNTAGTGAGGNTNISAQTLTIQNGGVLSASTTGTAPSATGGNISVLAGQSVTLNNKGTITASSTGPANAGNITINAGSQFMSQNSSVTTEASQADGGDITIQATDAIRLVNSKISTSVEGGPGTSGGNITIDPAVMTLQNSQILTTAVQGQGGNINITAGTFLADATSLVDASSQFGLSGAVNIQSPVAMLSGTLATLPKQPLPVQHLLQQRCAAQVNGQLSSLVVAGRDTLPSEPGGWLMSPWRCCRMRRLVPRPLLAPVLMSSLPHRR